MWDNVHNRWIACFLSRNESHFFLLCEKTRTDIHAIQIKIQAVKHCNFQAAKITKAWLTVLTNWSMELKYTEIYTFKSIRLNRLKKKKRTFDISSFEKFIQVKKKHE